MERYQVGAQLYKVIPKNVEPILQRMGLSLENPPKEYQSFFDSFLMLSALAANDGLKSRTLVVQEQGWEHIGGTSMGRSITKDAVYHYVTARFMGLLSDPVLAEEYRRVGLATADMAGQCREVLEPSIAHRVDVLVDRVELAA